MSSLFLSLVVGVAFGAGPVVDMSKLVVGAPDAHIVHLVMTRYGIGQSQYPVLGAARRQQFETISRASLAGQTDRRFFWVLTCDVSALEGLERQRLADPDGDWYRFVAVDEVEHHLQFIPLKFLNEIFGDWRQQVERHDLKHLVTTHLDVDDALPMDYFERTNHWYAKSAREPDHYPTDNGYKGACSNVEVTWAPDEKSPNGLVHPPAMAWQGGCLASGIVVARPVNGTFRQERCKICTIHVALRKRHPGLFTLYDASIFRVRSITSSGALNLRFSDKDDGYVPADSEDLAATFNITNIKDLNTHLIDESIGIAREMLDESGNASGCNPKFAQTDDICGRSRNASINLLKARGQQVGELHELSEDAQKFIKHVPVGPNQLHTN